MLILAGTAIAALGLPVSLKWLERENAADIEASILSLLSDQPGAAQIGQLWQSKIGDAMNARNVAARVAKRLHPYGWKPGVDAETAHEALAARVRRDFVAGDMVDIEGWQLSRTSAELCLLAALHFAPETARHA
jgi:hypothetical protein